MMTVPMDDLHIDSSIPTHKNTRNMVAGLVYDNRKITLICYNYVYCLCT